MHFVKPSRFLDWPVRPGFSLSSRVGLQAFALRGPSAWGGFLPWSKSSTHLSEAPQTTPSRLPGHPQLNAAFQPPRPPHSHESDSESEVAQSCQTLYYPMDYDLPGSFIHGILQARLLEQIAIPFSRGSSPPRDRTGSPALQADSLPSELPGNLTPLHPSISTSSQFLPTTEQLSGNKY